MAILEAVLTFAVVFGLLVIFHELGHFLAAKLFRMPVEEFAVNFGPKIATLFRAGGTEYNLRSIPLGGFVRIAGMEIHSGEPQAEAPRDGFNDRPIYQRFWVILAGPVFSFLLGYLCYVALYALYGVPTGRPLLQKVLPDRPAMRAGLREGDVIEAVNGQVLTSGELIETISGAVGQPLTFSVRRGEDGAVKKIRVTPEGVREGNTVIGRIGIQPGFEMRPTRGGEAFSAAGRAMVLYFQMLKEIIDKGKAKEAVGGPVGIARTFYQTAGTGSSTKLELMASLSLSLGLFNLFPIPILDGGHLLLLTIEAVRRRKLSADAMMRVYVTGFAIMAALFLFVLFNDISKWVSG